MNLPPKLLCTVLGTMLAGVACGGSAGDRATSDDDRAASDDGPWTVEAADCPDSEAVTAPIEDEVVIGLTAPLSGGAATAFVPSVRALEAYVDYANQNDLLEGIDIQVEVRDDQFDPGQTPAAVDSLLDDGVHLISGISGTGPNLAVRNLLNEECVPHLNAFSGAPELGNPAEFPWTTGALVPYDVEVKAYAAEIHERFPDGATVATFAVNSDFGLVYSETINEVSDEYGLTVTDSQTVEAADTAPPTAQVNAIARRTPDAIVAVPLGAGCVSFLGEIANARAAKPDWDPDVYITSTCASDLILSAAGSDADGVLSAANGGLVDIGNPSAQAQPGPDDYVAFMEDRGLADAITTGAIGWTVAETTVETLRQAAASPDGLTRQSIMEAARGLEYEPMLARPGVVYRTRGAADPVLVEAVQVIQYEAGEGTFTDVGDLNTSFESS